MSIIISSQEAQLSQRPRDASCHWIFRYSH